MNPNQDIAIVTGAGSGIGRATAIALSKKQFHVILVGRRESPLQETLNLMQNSGDILTCDLSQESEVQKCFNSLLNQENFKTQLKVLVNNAGQFERSSFEDTPSDTWERLFQINLMGVVYLTRLLWPLFKTNQEGCIINVSSTLGLKPLPGTLAYSVLKSSLNSLTEGLALEGAPYNIRVNAVLPGIVDTPIHDFHHQSPAERGELQKTLNSLQPLGRIGHPQEIAHAICHFTDPKSSWTTGSLLKVDGGIHLTSKAPS